MHDLALLFHENASMAFCFAGLLTFSALLGLPAFIFFHEKQWHGFVSERHNGDYSSGTVRDFHPVPF